MARRTTPRVGDNAVQFLCLELTHTYEAVQELAALTSPAGPKKGGPPVP